MTKLLGTFAAIERYALVRDEVDHLLTASAPKEYDVLHGCVLPEEEPWTGIYAVVADADEPVVASRFDSLKSACGTRTKVFLPVPFDTDHPKACTHCADELGRGLL